MSNQSKKMPVWPGSKWKCIDTYNEHFGKICTIVSFENSPDLNGDGHIELLYEDGTEYYGKYRRFIPGITHELISF